MMKTRKLISIFIISLFLILIGSTKSEASLHLNNLDFNVQINEDGSMNVTETWDIDISETNTLYKTFDIDKEKYTAITDFKVEEITNGTIKEFRKSDLWKHHIDENYYFGGINQDGNYEVAWGVNITSNAKRKYEISYRVIDAVKKYGDCTELYWQFIGDRFEIKADKITGTIKLPVPVQNKEELRVWGHTKYLNGEIYATDTRTIEFHLEDYTANEYVEVRILMPTYVMNNLEFTSLENKEAEILEEEEKEAAEANARRAKRDKQMQITIIAITAIVGLIGLVFINGIRKNIKALKNNPKIEPEVKLDYYRELPDEIATPLEANFILNKGTFDFSKTISATILDLTLKGYIKVEQIDKTINIEILDKDTSELPKDELRVLELLKNAEENKRAKEKNEEAKKLLTMKDVEKYIEQKPEKIIKVQGEFEKIAKDVSENKAKYDKKIAKKSETYITKVIGYIFLLIAVVMAVIIGNAVTGEFVPNIIKYALIAGSFTTIVLITNLVLISKLINRFSGFTSKGINEQEQWKAFKKYMEDFSLLDEKEIPHLVIWEKYLIFATAFGIADKVIKQLKIIYPELNEQDTLNNLVLFAAMSNSGVLNTNFISSLNTSTSHMYSSTYSSGSGSGGGFSGGGGGGGRRWRPEEEDKKPCLTIEKNCKMIYNI